LTYFWPRIFQLLPVPNNPTIPAPNKSTTSCAEQINYFLHRTVQLLPAPKISTTLAPNHPVAEQFN